MRLKHELRTEFTSGKRPHCGVMQVFLLDGSVDQFVNKYWKRQYCETQ